MRKNIINEINKHPANFINNLLKKERKGKMYIQILRKNKDWYWRLLSSNHKVLAHSETYSSRAKCLKTATNVFTGTIWEMFNDGEKVKAKKRTKKTGEVIK